MSDVYRNGILYLANDRFQINFSEEVPHLKNLKTFEVIPIQIVEIPSKFRWVHKGIKYFLLLERDKTEKIPYGNTIDYICPIKLSTSKK